MPQQVVSVVSMLHVTNVSASAAFYARLGFRVANSFTPPGRADPAWVWLNSGQANIMLALASGPIDPEAQAVLFYLYFTDVVRTRVELLGQGIPCGDICYPFYAPKGEFRITDPDGYGLMIMHT